MCSPQHRRKVVAPSRVLQICCYALLCLATWCGPVPWLHCHALTGDVEALTEHRHLHHPEGEVAGWHFHLVLLTELRSNGCGQECPGEHEPASPPLGLPLAYGASVVCSPAGSAAPLAATIYQDHLDWPAMVPAQSLFFDNFTSNVATGRAGSRPDVDCRTEFCVARC